MANPQLKDGRTEIPNELVDALAKAPLSRYESQMLWAILRKTYGWHKESDTISFTQFEQLTGMDRRHVGRTLNKLCARNIITRHATGYINEYGLQTDYTLWINKDGSANLGTGAETGTIANSGNTPSANLGTEVLPELATDLVPELAPTKAIKQLTKANIQKQGSDRPSFRSSLKKIYEDTGNGERP